MRRVVELIVRRTALTDSADNAPSIVNDDDLVRRGLDAGRLTAAGKGETEPIAGNDDESGRSLNRRVEVECGQ